MMVKTRSQTAQEQRQRGARAGQRPPRDVHGKKQQNQAASKVVAEQQKQEEPDIDLRDEETESDSYSPDGADSQTASDESTEDTELDHSYELLVTPEAASPCKVLDLDLAQRMSWQEAIHLDISRPPPEPAPPTQVHHHWPRPESLVGRAVSQHRKTCSCGDPFCVWAVECSPEELRLLETSAAAGHQAPGAGRRVVTEEMEQLFARLSRAVQYPWSLYDGPVTNVRSNETMADRSPTPTAPQAPFEPSGSQHHALMSNPFANPFQQQWIGNSFGQQVPVVNTFQHNPFHQNPPQQSLSQFPFPQAQPQYNLSQQNQSQFPFPQAQPQYNHPQQNQLQRNAVQQNPFQRVTAGGTIQQDNRTQNQDPFRQNTTEPQVLAKQQPKQVTFSNAPPVIIGTCQAPSSQQQSSTRPLLPDRPLERRAREGSQASERSDDTVLDAFRDLRSEPFYVDLRNVFRDIVAESTQQHLPEGHPAPPNGKYALTIHVSCLAPSKRNPPHSRGETCVVTACSHSATDFPVVFYRASRGAFLRVCNCGDPRAQADAYFDKFMEKVAQPLLSSQGSQRGGTTGGGGGVALAVQEEEWLKKALEAYWRRRPGAGIGGGGTQRASSRTVRKEAAAVIASLITVLKEDARSAWAREGFDAWDGDSSLLRLHLLTWWTASERVERVGREILRRMRRIQR